MRHRSELKKLNDTWAADILDQIEKIPDEVERLRLLIEVEKVNRLSEIAQGIALHHDCQ